MDTGPVVHTVTSQDGTTVAYLSLGEGPSVLVVPGVLSTAADYADFARALGAWFTVHVVERRGRGISGPQGADYNIRKECEDLHAVRLQTGAALLVGHSYGGLVSLEAGRANDFFDKIAVYEPGVSVGGSMPTDWMPGYQRKLTEGKKLDALVEFTLADAPARLQRTPPFLMKWALRLLFMRFPQQRGMLELLEQNLREWQEIVRLDDSFQNYREISAQVLFMHGSRSDSRAVILAAEALDTVISRYEVREFRGLDHFGIEREAPGEVAAAVREYFTKP